MMMVSKTNENFLLGALIGGAIGTTLALLLTPVSGEEFRSHVQKGLDHLNGKKYKKPAHKTGGYTSKRVSKSLLATAEKKKKRSVKRSRTNNPFPTT